ncbi:SDR family oxidoreductase [bacterium AH-315-E07]|nr:SDR family oxidoreductase [bacterium AH-315-E07]
MILVTGANGFVGSELCRALERTGYRVRRGLRTFHHSDETIVTSAGVVAVGEIGPETTWDEALKDVVTVVHLAARVHVLNNKHREYFEEFFRVNTVGTERLARLAANAGVKRFVYVSTVKVNGGGTGQDQQGVAEYYSEEDEPDPQDAYGVSKCEAEQVLQRIAVNTGMEVVIVRPPLVYGPGVKANFLRLLEWVDRGIPLPFGSVTNCRSLVALDNLVDFLLECVKNPAAAGEIFLVSDGEDLSTLELTRRIVSHMKRPVRLIAVPPNILRLGARLLGKQDMADRLLGSLQVDTAKARSVLEWEPPVSVDEALSRTVAWYLREKEGRNA